MKINVYAMMRMDHQVNRAKAFCKGLKKHGFTDVSVQHHNKPTKCDLAVFWGMHHSRPIQQMQKQHKNDWLMMERGYIGDRFHWTSLAYNGLNGYGQFDNKNSPSDRWDRFFGDELKEWHDGNHILITGQVPGDASMKHVGGRLDYNKMVMDIQKHTNKKILFRPHPQRKTAPPRNTKPSTGNLQQALARAHCVVTFNSNTSVDAVLAGTPCIVQDKGSMAWEVCGHKILQVNNPPRLDRMQWCYNMAYTQWSPEEIADGTAWEHIGKRFMQGQE